MDKRQLALLMFNSAIAGSMGLYQTVIKDENGGDIVYYHNKPNLSDSKIVYTYGANGFAWTNTGWKGDATVWKYGFDKNGNAILNAIYAYTLSADVITSGLLKSKNGASWINLDNGTFSFGKKDILGLLNVPMLSLDDDGYISMFGRIRSQLDKDLSLGFWGQGISIRDESKAIGSKERFAVDVSNNSINISAAAAGDNLLISRRCRIDMTKSTIYIVHGSALTGATAYLRLESDYEKTDSAKFQLDAKNKGIRVSDIHTVLYNGTHTAFLGNDGVFYVEDSAFISDRAKKENIVQIEPSALENIENMNFYSYNIIEGGAKVKMGVMADEAPEEILGGDGKSISTYPFMCYIARSVQELNGIVKSQAGEIAALKEEIKNIKEALTNENI